MVVTRWLRRSRPRKAEMDEKWGKMGVLSLRRGIEWHEMGSPALPDQICAIVFFQRSGVVCFSSVVVHR